MIFPDFRLSELEKDRELKRLRFNQSVTIFRQEIREHLNPLVLVRKYPKIFFGTLASITGTIFGIKKISSHTSEKTPKPVQKTSGWVKQLAMMGGMTIIKLTLPLLTEVVKTGVHRIRKTSR